MSRFQMSTRVVTPIFFASHVTSIHCLSISHRDLPESSQPLAQHVSKRSTTSQKVGIGMAITISIVLFAMFIFYLGMRRGRAGTWFCWRESSSSSPVADESSRPVSVNTWHGNHNNRKSKRLPALPDEEKELCIDKEEQMRDLSLDYPQPAELSPIDARHPYAELSSPRESQYLPPLELSGQTKILDLGSRRSSWFEERKNWFSSDRKRSTARRKSKSSKSKSRETSMARDPSIYEMPATPIGSCTPPVPPLPPKLKLRGEEEGAGANGGMDWSGMEFVRKMYVERKSLYRNGP
ncbi:hypothetical protein B0J11DRAFT_509160 [Dendryphion nanum]|uniref:Uncharacterized protein n=1 Tax=Dendryphion nanum TaxID=256645 RepID=A0A9P9DEI7_9PLEO|nr:hypothetical protein B0J11DRAFT_509160 [Dendryphion nanum]